MIDINKPDEFKKLKLADLINDAVARKNKEALEWLKVEANSMKTRKREDGTEYEVRKSIVEIRANYVKKFLNYKTKGAAAKERAKQAKAEKQQREIDNMFEDAFKAIG